MIKKDNLNEFVEFTTFGKVFMSLAAAWVLGRVVSAKIRGNKQQIQTLANAMASSRRYQDELKRSGATPESVFKKLGIKNLSAENFEKVFGIPWPL